MNVTGFPAILTQTLLFKSVQLHLTCGELGLLVIGSEPSCSIVKPLVSVTFPGTVIGISAVQLLLVVVRVIPVIVCSVGFVFKVN